MPLFHHFQKEKYSVKIYPHYPKTVKTKISQYMTFFNKSNSWLDGLYERSYTMKMGRVTLPKLDLYIPNEPDLIQRIMIKEAKAFPKHPLLQETLAPLLGESIFTTNGKVWKEQRELLNPSFEMTRISHVFDLMHDASEDMLLRMDLMADGEYHNIDKEMTFVTADIIFRTILSQKLSQEEGEEIIKNFQTFQEQSAKIGMQKLFRLPSLFRKFGSNRAYKRSGQSIRNSLSSIIKPRYQNIQKEEKNTHKDILSSLLQVKDKDNNQAFSFEEILDQVAMLFLAGHETTASSLSWSIYLLGLYPDIQEEAYQEIQAICGNHAFNPENTKKLIKVTNIFKETLRLYPPVGFFARVNTTKTTLRNKIIPKNSAIIISPWLMQRNAYYWEDPHMFNPKRFENPQNIHKYSYFPFGLGKRTCIGEKFAMQESILLLSSILREFKIELKKDFIPNIAGRLTIRSLNGIPIKLIKRVKV